MLEIGRLSIASGPVLAWVGLVIFGMGESFPPDSDHEVPFFGTDYSVTGIWMMIIGLVIFAVGLVIFRATDERD